MMKHGHEDTEKQDTSLVLNGDELVHFDITS